MTDYKLTLNKKDANAVLHLLFTRYDNRPIDEPKFQSVAKKIADCYPELANQKYNHPMFDGWYFGNSKNTEQAHD